MPTKLSRRGRIGAVILGVILLSGLILYSNAIAGKKTTTAYTSAIVEVFVEPSTLSSLPADGPFYMKGQVFLLGTLAPDGTAPSDAEPIGPWHCWGYVSSGTGDTVESQTFMLNGYGGKLQVQGPEGADVLPVTGGTGSFKGARGEATFQRFEGNPGSFRVFFSFVEDQVCDHSHCQH